MRKSGTYIRVLVVVLLTAVLIATILLGEARKRRIQTGLTANYSNMVNER